MNKKRSWITACVSIVVALAFVFAFAGCSGCSSCEEEEEKNYFVKQTLDIPETVDSITVTSAKGNSEYQKTITKEKTINKILEAMSTADTADKWIDCGDDAGVLTFEMKKGEEIATFYLSKNMLQAKSSWLYIDVENANEIFELVKNAK